MIIDWNDQRSQIGGYQNGLLGLWAWQSFGAPPAPGTVTSDHMVVIGDVGAGDFITWIGEF